MSEVNVSMLINEILSNGNIKFYKSDGSLASMAQDIDDAAQKENSDYDDYLKSVEKDFRGTADDILRRLDLSHLVASRQNNGH